MDSVGFYARTSPSPWWGSEPEFGKDRENWGQTSWESLMHTSLTHTLPNGIRVEIVRSGIIILDLPEGVSIAQLFMNSGDDVLDTVLDIKANQIRYLNALSICLHSGVLSASGHDLGPVLVTAENALAVTRNPTGEFNGSSGPRTSELASIIREEGHRFFTVHPDALSCGVKNFERVLSGESTDLVEIVSLLNEAACAFKQHNFALTVVAAWSICERLQNVAWDRYLSSASDQGRIILNSKRRKDMKHEYTASIIGTILQLAGILDPELVARLNTARAARNNWLHAGKRPDRIVSRACIEAATTMLQETYGIELVVGSSLSVSG